MSPRCAVCREPIEKGPSLCKPCARSLDRCGGSNLDFAKWAADRAWRASATATAREVARYVKGFDPGAELSPAFIAGQIKRKFKV